MFSKIVLDNFTTFNHFEFDLIENKTDKKAKKLAIIYGENGIGKTCLIRSFKLLKVSYESLIIAEGMSRFLASTKNSGQASLNDPYKMIFANFFNDNRVSGYLKKYYKLNTSKEMKASYEVIINKKKYLYTMVFSKSAIIQEKLMCNGEIVFACRSNKIEYGDNFLFSNEIKEKLNSSFQMYFGEKHTFLACINYLRKGLTLSYFKQNIAKDLISFIDFLDGLVVVTKEDDDILLSSSIPTYSNTFLSPISSGQYNAKMQKKLEKTTVALSMFFSSLYSNIQSIEYRIDTAESGSQSYHMYFVENKNGEIISIPYELESTGTKKMAALFTNLYELVKNKKTIVIDEIDNGINDLLLKSVFESLEDSICGQFIVTTHNTLLLRFPIKKNIFLLDRDESGSVISFSLDEFGRKIQAGTDIVGQYLKGLYGGVPQSGAFSMKYIAEALEDDE